jgi:soluble lytic murein transglycosylase-like protein
MPPLMGGSTSWRTLAEMDLVFAQSRRRAAAKRAEAPRRAAINWRTVRVVVLAVALLGFIGETTRVQLAPAKPRAPKKAAATGTSCGIPTTFAAAFRKASRETRLSLSLLSAVAWEESGMNPSALSRAGAQGLLQLMPGTAKAVAIAETSPQANIAAGARYLRLMVNRFDGDLELALAAYNAGPTAVDKAGQAPSIATLRYVKNVVARATRLRGCR